LARWVDVNGTAQDWLVQRTESRASADSILVVVEFTIGIASHPGGDASLFQRQSGSELRIGGSGMSRLADLQNIRQQVIRTPYGEASGTLSLRSCDRPLALAFACNFMQAWKEEMHVGKSWKIPTLYG
jgi:hypothetical protein